jgi:preprotein translocase subunit YajC
VVRVFGMSPEGGSLLQMLVPLAMVFAIFYFIVIVPSKRQQKKVQEFVDNLKVNDKVITTSGIYGQIMKLDDQSVQLQVADKVNIKVAKASIGGIQGQPPVVETSSKP